MEDLKLSLHGTTIHIEGFPDAVSVLAVQGPKARRLADLALHQSDLEFASQCLDSINLLSAEPRLVHQALWRSAIIHYMKCFGEGARFQLTAERIYKTESPLAMENFRFFKALRNKHFVHDENAYAQCNPGAVLNDGTKPFKIEKIVCVVVVGETLDQIAYANLKLLLAQALAWVIAEFDALCNQLTAELEVLNYSQLSEMPRLITNSPTLEEINARRKAP